MRAVNYRMNRMSYAVLLAGLVVAYAVMVNILERPPGAEMFVALIAVPRLHDIGLSGWWLLILFAGEVVAVAIGWQGGTHGIMLAVGVYVLLAVAVLTILVFIPGQPGSNRWGYPPEGGIRLGRDPAAPDPE